MYSYKRKNVFIKNNRFIFNGHNLSNLVVVERVHRTVLPTITNDNKHIPRRIGSTLIDRQVGSRLITVDIRIIEDDSRSVKTLINELGSKLFTLEPATLELNDSHLYNEAMLVGDTNLETLAYTGRVSLVFECHDPFNYGQLKEANINEPFDNNGGYSSLGTIEFETEATDKVSINAENHHVENLIPEENRTFEGWSKYGSGENLMSVQDFSNFMVRADAKVTITPKQEVKEWGTNEAYMIEASSSRIVNKLSYVYDGNTDNDVISILVKNIGDTNIVIGNNEGHKNVTVQPGETKFVRIEREDPLLSYKRFHIRSEVKEEGIKGIFYLPSISKKESEYLTVLKIPLENGFTRIRTWGGSHLFKYFYGIGRSLQKTTTQVFIKNNGTKMQVANNLGGRKVIDKGFIGDVTFHNKENTDEYPQIRFESHDNIDITVWRPSIVEGEEPYNWDFKPIKTSTLLLEDKFLDGEKIVIDLDKRYITRNGYSAMDVLSLESDFFEIPHGEDMKVNVEGAKSGKVKFRERWL